jgi:hypothetical protein
MPSHIALELLGYATIAGYAAFGALLAIECELNPPGYPPTKLAACVLLASLGLLVVALGFYEVTKPAANFQSALHEAVWLFWIFMYLLSFAAGLAFALVKNLVQFPSVHKFLSETFTSGDNCA